MHTPPSLVFLSLMCSLPASSVRSRMFLCSQVSVITMMQLSIRLLTSCNLILFILLTRERTLTRKMLGTAGLCRVAASLALMLAYLSRFTHLSQHHHRLLSVRSRRCILSGNKSNSSGVQPFRCCFRLISSVQVSVILNV